MEETHKDRWLGISYLALIVVLFIGFVYAAYVGSKDERDRRSVNTAARLPSRTDGVDIFLSLGREQKVGKNKLIYNGLMKGRIHIAVYIAELDPKVAYHHTITIKEARKGIRLGGQPFILISAGKSSIHLKRNP